MLFCVSLMPEIKCLFHFNLATSHCWYFRHSIPSCFSCVWLFATLWTIAHQTPLSPWTAACQAPLSMGFLRKKILEWVAMPSSKGSSWTHIFYVSWIGRRVLYQLPSPGKPMCVYIEVCISVYVCACVSLSPNLSDSLYNSKTLLSYGVCYLNYEQTQDLWK